ncbi:MAG: P-II family nitrogen regulator [Candidatus Paceibacterota bacterium]|jgi:nitrogen regulatory protein P-II 1
MKRIEAVIQPHTLDDVRKALIAIGVEGMTVFEAKGFGRQHGHTEIYRGSEYDYHFVPKIYILLMVKKSQVKQVVATIREAANTKKIGAGKIFVSPLEDAIRIRTNEDGEGAL